MQHLIITGPSDSEAYSEMERLADLLQAKQPATVRVTKLRKHPSLWPAERAQLAKALGLGAALVPDIRAPFCFQSTGRLIGDLAVFRDLARSTYGVVLDLDPAGVKSATATNLAESEREKRQFAMLRSLRGGKRALLVIDVQNDFCTGGALAVPHSERVVALANKLRATCLWDLIVLTQDWHPREHGSFAVNNDKSEVYSVRTMPDMGDQVMWPVHCVQGSAGAEFHPLLVRRGPPGGPEPEEVVVLKGTNARVDSYSGFGDAQGGKIENTGLDAILRARGVTDVFVCGLALDFCVAYTCKDAVRKGYQAFCLAGAAAGITDAGIAKERELMKAAGVILVDNADDVPTRDVDEAVAAGVTGGVLASPDPAVLAAAFAAAPGPSSMSLPTAVLAFGRI